MGILGSIFDRCTCYVYPELEYFTVVLMIYFSPIPKPSFVFCFYFVSFLGWRWGWLVNDYLTKQSSIHSNRI